MALPIYLPPAAVLLGVASFAVLALGAVWHRRVVLQNRRLLEAINNMSQGLCMFDAQMRVLVRNTRYLEMYRLSPDVVKPGATLREIIQHRIDTGLLKRNIDEYCRQILDGVRSGRSEGYYVPAADGRIVFTRNEPLPDGGWVATHEDVTEQRRAEEERAAIQSE